MGVFVEVSLGEFDRMYQRLNITFDRVLGESFYNDKMQAVVAQLRAKGLLEESDGALVVRLEDEELPPCLILKRMGPPFIRHVIWQQRFIVMK